MQALLKTQTKAHISMDKISRKCLNDKTEYVGTIPSSKFRNTPALFDIVQSKHRWQSSKRTPDDPSAMVSYQPHNRGNAQYCLGAHS